MKRYSFVLVVGLALLMVALALPWSAVAQDDMTASGPVMRFSDGSEVESAWSTLRRSENGLMMALHTSDLAADEVYTVWWVIFNEPGNCSDGMCGENDIFVFEGDEIMLDDDNNPSLNMEGIEAAQISVQFAAGGYVDDDGVGHFGGSAAVGDVPGIVFGPGLQNPLTAEVHLVVRTHGPIIEDLFDEQITSFGGACGPIDNGLPCQDHQFSVFPPG